VVYRERQDKLSDQHIFVYHLFDRQAVHVYEEINYANLYVFDFDFLFGLKKMLQILVDSQEFVSILRSCEQPQVIEIYFAFH
jgi:hypothetical protein